MAGRRRTFVGDELGLTAAAYARRYGSEFPLPDTRSEDIVQVVSPAAGNSTDCDNIGTAAPVTEEPARALPLTGAAATAGRAASATEEPMRALTLAGKPTASRAAPATEEPMRALTLAGEPIARAAAGPTRATRTPGNESIARAARTAEGERRAFVKAAGGSSPQHPSAEDRSKTDPQHHEVESSSRASTPSPSSARTSASSSGPQTERRLRGDIDPYGSDWELPDDAVGHGDPYANTDEPPPRSGARTPAEDGAAGGSFDEEPPSASPGLDTSSAALHHGVRSPGAAPLAIGRVINLQKFGIPDVLGYIDGTEITITPPYSNMNPQTFWTRKHQYALNCQVLNSSKILTSFVVMVSKSGKGDAGPTAVCDSSLYIMNMVANFPGSCNDAFIFKSSAVRRRMRAAFEEEPCWLLGDSGYPNEPWCIIPLLDTEPGSPEEHFTKKHCRSRNCVERCIGVLKSRFRCLLKDRTLHYLPLRAAKMVKACTVLHNMCITSRIPVPEPQIVEGEELGVAWVPQLQEVEEAAIEAAIDEDERLALDPADGNIGIVGEEVRNRLVQFLHINRLLLPDNEDEPPDAAEANNHNEELVQGRQYQLIVV
ncbi:Putative nuclease [Frankliniella fusca]|uniref:Nuclease n=1 Tax=Frankliniella fusca TaxID=407009 RepID=A0AAE1HAM6_9NEOP|nr:Putative nuclease [Frankliniella fusca]